MSNRTLIEINHDYGHKISKVWDKFLEAIEEGIRGGFNEEVRAKLEPYGVRVFGTRHHSDAFTIDWGGVKADELSPPKR